jgi:type II secretory pathway pseudopilin PulG
MRSAPGAIQGEARCSLGNKGHQSDLGVMACPLNNSAVILPSIHRPRSRGITLLETLLATAVLLIVVTAVMSALSAGRAQSETAKQVVSATLAAEMLMARVTSVQPESFQTGQAWRDHFTSPVSGGGWNGHIEHTGQVRAGRDLALPLLPTGYQELSLHVHAADQTQLIPPPIATAIEGVEIAVEAHSADDRTVARLVRFLPMPQTLAGAGP